MQTLLQNDTTSELNEEPFIQTGVRIPRPLWYIVKQAALDRRTSAQQITINALTAYLKQKNIRAA